MIMTVTPVYAESSLTDRYQTKIPETLRKILGLNKRDKINYSIQTDGKVVIYPVEESENDLLLTEFLNFIVEDIKNNPQNLQPINSDLINHVELLVSEVDLNINLPLSDENE